jgi:hypothetical protein
VDLLGGVVLVAAEDVRLGTLGVAQLMNLCLGLSAKYLPPPAFHTYHGTVCDQADQRILREQAQAHDDRVLERLQAVLLLACVHDEYEDRRGLDRLRKAVLDGSAVCVQLWGYLLLRDVLVVRREVVTVETEGAYPHAGAHVDLTVLSLVLHVSAEFMPWPTRKG